MKPPNQNAVQPNERCWLAGRHAIVTGGSSGIGLACASALTAEGARVSLIARRQGGLEEAARMLPGAATASADVADAAALAAAIARLESRQGPCDILVTSAGQARPGRFSELDDDVFRTMIEVDYFGTLHAIRTVVPGMVARRSGAIVAVSSAAALLGIYGYTAYAPAKFAVRGLMEALRGELRPHGVYVGCVFPSDVDTPQLAEETRYKPEETAAISGTVTPISAAQVARAVIRGINRRRFAIYPDARIALLGRVASLAAPALTRLMDHKIDKIARIG